MSRMRSAALAGVALLSFPAGALAQGAVLQAGPVTPGQAAVWLRNGVIGGSATGNPVFASPPPIGNVAPNTGAFTTLLAATLDVGTLNVTGAITGAAWDAIFASPPPIGSTAANTGAFTTLNVASTVSGAGFAAWLASPPAIGTTAPASAIEGTYINAGTSGIDDAGSLNLTGNGSINFTGTGDIALNGGPISGVTSLSASGNIVTTGSLISGVNIDATGTMNISGAVTLNGTAGDLTAAAHGNAYIAESGTAYIADNAGTLVTGTIISDGTTLATNPMTLSGAGQVLTGGAHPTFYNAGTASTGTISVDCGNNPIQMLVNGGAFTLAMSANDGECVLDLENNGSAGTVTFSSAFSEGANAGDALDTTSGHLFHIALTRINGHSHYLVSALQ